MISPGESDERVLAFLRAEGPGTVTVKRIAEKTGLPRVTVRASVASLAVEGLVCLVADDEGETFYMIRHLHAEAGPCGHSLRCVIQEDGAR